MTGYRIRLDFNNPERESMVSLTRIDKPTDSEAEAAMKLYKADSYEIIDNKSYTGG